MSTISSLTKMFPPAGRLATALVVSGSLAVWAAPAPPAPPPAPQTAPAAPSAPAVNPATPGGPAPTGDVAAKARAAAIAAKANIDVGEAWTRATTGDNAAIYMRITSVKDADKLVGVDVALAGKAVVQDETRQNGAVRINPAETLDIPAGATIEFKPGARQLALSGLKSPLKEGESFLVTLKFEKAGTQNTSVKVLSPSANGLPPIGSTRKGDTTAAVSQIPKNP